jgi:hypothetical protein
VKDAREKLAARFGNAAQIGGKGKFTPSIITNILSPIKHIFLNDLFVFRYSEKKEEACYRPEC